MRPRNKRKRQSLDSEQIRQEEEEEDALVAQELQNLVASGGRAPPLWTQMGEFRGMTRAVQQYQNQLTRGQQRLPDTEPDLEDVIRIIAR